MLHQNLRNPENPGRECSIEWKACKVGRANRFNEHDWIKLFLRETALPPAGVLQQPGSANAVGPRLRVDYLGPSDAPLNRGGWTAATARKGRKGRTAAADAAATDAAATDAAAAGAVQPRPRKRARGPAAPHAPGGAPRDASSPAGTAPPQAAAGAADAAGAVAHPPCRTLIAASPAAAGAAAPGCVSPSRARRPEQREARARVRAYRARRAAADAGAPPPTGAAGAGAPPPDAAGAGAPPPDARAAARPGNPAASVGGGSGFPTPHGRSRAGIALPPSLLSFNAPVILKQYHALSECTYFCP